MISELKLKKTKECSLQTVAIKVHEPIQVNQIIFASIVSCVVHKISLQLNNSLTSSFEVIWTSYGEEEHGWYEMLIWLTFWLTIVEPTSAYVWVRLTNLEACIVKCV